MAQDELLDLAKQVESVRALDARLGAAALHALRAGFPAEAAAGLIPDGAASSADALLALAMAALPGWHFKIHGKARPAGEWTCSLRRSDVLDDDEILGTGDADSLPLALLAAVLRILARR
jgi:hypothetical protein